jgi:aminoglycoside/choline kinase family phosphotransferase
LAAAGWPVAELIALAGDVSARRYLRAVHPDRTTSIVAIYPETMRQGAGRFLATTELLSTAGIRVPAVRANDLAAGWMLLEDLGPLTVYELPGPDDIQHALAAAAAHLPRLAALPAAAVAGLNPPLDAALLRRELDQTRDLLLAPTGALGPELGAFDQALDVLCSELGALPAVPCHRDYMARNLVALADGQIAVLDHQDLRLGPPTYDLASLLGDTVFAPPEREEALLSAYLPPGLDRLAYHRAAAQRALKAAGTFVAFARRGSPRHLPLVPPTLAWAARHLAHLPELATRQPGTLSRLTSRRWELDLLH